jgi:type VI protein secretion system component VasF
MRGDDELSDAERRRLAEIESSLRADDPDFVQHFEQRRLRRRRYRRNIVAPMAVSAAVIVIVVALARGSLGAAVLGLIAAGAAAGLWATRRGT